MAFTRHDLWRACCCWFAGGVQHRPPALWIKSSAFSHINEFPFHVSWPSSFWQLNVSQLNMHPRRSQVKPFCPFSTTVYWTETGTSHTLFIIGDPCRLHKDWGGNHAQNPAGLRPLPLPHPSIHLLWSPRTWILSLEAQSTWQGATWVVSHSLTWSYTLMSRFHQHRAGVHWFQRTMEKCLVGRSESKVKFHMHSVFRIILIWAEFPIRCSVNKTSGNSPLIWIINLSKLAFRKKKSFQSMIHCVLSLLPVSTFISAKALSVHVCEFILYSHLFFYRYPIKDYTIKQLKTEFCSPCHDHNILNIQSVMCFPSKSILYFPLNKKNIYNIISLIS